MKNVVNRSLSMRGSLAQVLAALLAVAPLFGQSQAPPAPAPAPPTFTPETSAQPAQPAPASPTIQGLKVVPLAGKGEMNDLERHVMAPIVVEVMDQDDRPVEGAEVVFRFPINGPSATFTGGKTSQTVRTNGQGQAAARNWTANNQVGSLDVHVTASYGNQVGETTFQMSNVTRIVEEPKKSTRQGGWWSPTWVKAAIVGGTIALAVGVVLATRGGSSKTAASQPTITITPGSPTIGGPH
jgi:hypothetical protein